MWSPKRNRNGSFNRFYENMRLVDEGDLVFSYFDQLIQYIGVVQSPAVSGARPAEFADTIWDKDGWLVPVEWHRPPIIVRPKDMLGLLRPHLPSKYSPLQSETGNGLQSVYLAAVPASMAAVLLRPLGGWKPASSPITPEAVTSENAVERLEDQIEAKVKNDTSIDETERQAVVLARRGQGRFRKNLCEIERCCRITQIADPRLLRASHIKPWRACESNHERLDGNNGLLLSPHVDLLFDRGYISFEDDGTVLRSPRIDSADFARLGISTAQSFGVMPFSGAQAKYLEFHRSTVFLKDSGENNFSRADASA